MFLRYFYGLCFVPFTFAILFSGQASAQAEPSEPAKCRTNTGPDGILFNGFFGLVVPPVSYEAIETEGEKLTVYANSRYGLGALVFPGVYRGFFAPGGPAENASATGSVARLTFTQKDGSVVHSCLVEIVEFDPEIHDLNASAVGECGLNQTAGAPVLTPGHVQIFELPFELSEISGVPGAVLDVTPITADLIQVRGQSGGYGNFVWHPQGSGEMFPVGGICPVIVDEGQTRHDSQTNEDPVLCRDADGTAIELNVGDSARLPLEEFRQNINFFQGKLTQHNPPVRITTPIGFGSGGEPDLFEIVATDAGTMSLVRLAFEDNTLRYETCLVSVN